jgi:hypothetical protein
MFILPHNPMLSLPNLTISQHYSNRNLNSNHNHSSYNRSSFTHIHTPIHTHSSSNKPNFRQDLNKFPNRRLLLFRFIKCVLF